MRSHPDSITRRDALARLAAGGAAMAWATRSRGDEKERPPARIFVAMVGGPGEFRPEVSGILAGGPGCSQPGPPESLKDGSIRARGRGTIGVMDASSTQAAGNTAEPAQVIPVVAEHIGVRPGYCGGRPHILGHRIKVKHVAVWHERQGLSPAEIVAQHPTITLAQVHAALAYYYDHRAEIEAEIAEVDRLYDELRAKQPSLVETLRAE